MAKAVHVHPGPGGQVPPVHARKGKAKAGAE